ncbi:MAG: hypothetical protein OXU63_04785 [Acidobacteriota bacterium]|nr:hypothetical protein [Acidobacteriota bacterium]
MRQESWFRGALLSVLFFALLSGGAPTAVAADLQSVASNHQIETTEGPCQQPGYVNTAGGCMPATEVTHHNNCDMYGDLALAGGLLGAAGGLLAIIPEPVTTFVGGLLGLVGFGGLAAGTIAYIGNDC